jgi:hypothetical protein
MNIDQKLLANKILLESKWTQEYLEHGYTVGLTEIEKDIKEIRKKMISSYHKEAERMIKSPVEELEIST